MDFRQTTQAQPGRPTPLSPEPVVPEHKTEKEHKLHAHGVSKWMQIFNVVVLVGVAILLIGIAFVFARGSNDSESQYVDSSKYQAVFLNNGQVYFGNITKLNDKYVRMTNIYYLTQSSDATTSTSSSSYSLVKLGCQQIHDPTDAMVINRDQVTFWENLQSSGKVVTSIKQFVKQNPSGPNCSEVSTQTQASTSTTQGGTDTTTK